MSRHDASTDGVSRPSVGGASKGGLADSENFIGTPGMRTVPPPPGGTSTSMSRTGTCGSGVAFDVIARDCMTGAQSLAGWCCQDSSQIGPQRPYRLRWQL